jgi:hypothetical protein
MLLHIPLKILTTLATNRKDDKISKFPKAELIIKYTSKYAGNCKVKLKKENTKNKLLHILLSIQIAVEKQKMKISFDLNKQHKN